MTERKRLALLTLGAFVLRVAVAAVTVDIPGDGPSRAVQAYTWSLHPFWVPTGVWLPLDRYLGGLVNMAWPDPAWASRALNIVAGTLTIPLYVVLVREAFDARIAWGAGLLLACLPLHVGLSASSLSEAPSLLLIVAALALLCRPSLSGREVAAGVACLLLAEMSRYEAWVVAAVCLGLVKDRRVMLAGGAALAVFPLYWLAMGSRAFGSVWYIANEELRGTETPHGALGLFSSLRALMHLTASEIGWGFLVLMAAGALAGPRGPVGRKGLFALGGLAFVGNLHLVSAHGGILWERELLLMLVFWLPFGLALVPARSARVWGCALVGLAGLSFYRHPPQMYVMPDTLAPVRQVASWLKTGPYGDTPLVMTRCQWWSTYLPMLYPPCATHESVVSDWMSDSSLAQFLRENKPPIVITIPGDEPMLRRIESVGRGRVETALPLFQAAPFVVYGVSW